MHTVTGVIFCIKNQEGRFLLQQRDQNSPQDKWSWVFPGGGLDSANEDPRGAVIREAQEEFGIQLSATDLAHIGNTVSGADSQNSVFLCTIKTLSEPLVLSEGAGAGWFSLEEISRLKLGYDQSTLVVPLLQN